ncbi:TSC22 domain family protein 1 isoform X1 [Denticeps clupeoides]|uniref:TSC22 domain family protein 1 isoform X1 n=2 Tax=Denticeps clupeoides TaxID=299321 RepID=UPI0010A322CC|nr:TSC22 domain family protein 1-like isoform X1 [Denticeps clupeoides]
MHHADSSGESPGARKMAHPSVFISRRGSNPGSAGSSVIQTDDQQTPPAGCSSPGPHHHPPQSLSLPAQSLQSAQVKKKSGFQITSVTPAQVSASANNSIADDTESFDDMDESHTEDLSSSDILDVSVSRATDHGVPERSSSEETLNSLHGVETPGVASPNEPVHHHHPHPQAGQPGYMVNGSVHPHHHHGLHQDHGAHPSVASVPVATQGRAPAAVPVGTAVNIAAVPSSGAGGNQILRPIPVRAVAIEGAVSGVPTQPPSSVLVPGASMGVSSAPLTGSQQSVGVVASTSQPTPAAASQVQASAAAAAAVAASTATASRFRVVKLDSNSEPFRKGRWMCTEFYEKEPPPTAAPTAVEPTPRAVESTIQSTASESESTSSSSVGSTVGESVMPPGHPAFPTPAVIPTQIHPPSIPLITPQTLIHPQDAGVLPPIHPTASMTPAAKLQPVGHTGAPGSEIPAARPQAQRPYTADPQTGQAQPSYPSAANAQQSTGSVSQAGMKAPEFTQHQQGVQTMSQTHQLPQMPMGAVPIGTPVAGTISGHPAQTAAQRPSQSLAAAVQTGLVPGSTSGLPLQHSTQVLQEAKPQAGTPAASAVSTQSALIMQHPLLAHAGAALQAAGLTGHPSGMGLPLTPLAPAAAPYAGMSSLTASKLEDAQRLLFPHQTLLTLPRLAVVEGQGTPEAGSGVGAEGPAGVDASALANVAGTEEDSSSGASVVAIDNKIEQAMDLVKSHLMYAVREEVEVLKEQIKELIERNSQLEQENNLLKNLASPEQLAQFQAQVQTGSPTSGTQPGIMGQAPPPSQTLPPTQGTGPAS